MAILCRQDGERMVLPPAVKTTFYDFWMNKTPDSHSEDVRWDFKQFGTIMYAASQPVSKVGRVDGHEKRNTPYMVTLPPTTITGMEWLQISSNGFSSLTVDVSSHPLRKPYKGSPSQVHIFTE